MASNTFPASPMLFDWTRTPLRPGLGLAHDPGTAAWLRALRAALARGDTFNPWLPVPQQGANAGFGPQARPLPVGALVLLWDASWPFVQACVGCGGQAWLVSAGGHPSVGGFDLVCPDCTARWHQPVGGLRRVMTELNARALDGTPFACTGPQPHSSDGAALLMVLTARWGAA